MGFFRRKYAWAAVYAVILTLYTVYAALDTFVIARVYAIEPAATTSAVATVRMVTPSPIAVPAVSTSTPEPTTMPQISSIPTAAPTPLPEGAYSDDNITIIITELREYETDIYVADIKLSSPEYLKTAFASNAYGRNVTDNTSDIARENDAILAINGDYYGAQSRGYVLRNGRLYRDIKSERQQDLVIWQDGSFEIIAEDEVSAESLLNDGAAQVFSFGPALVVESVIPVTSSGTVGYSTSRNPRTAIGIVDELHYLFVVADGRTNESEGLTLFQLADVMQNLGVTTAYNLDGGGSTTMYYDGEVINKPSSGGQRIVERSVSDIVYIGY